MAAQGTQDHRISIIQGGSSSRTHPVQPVSLSGMTRTLGGFGHCDKGCAFREKEVAQAHAAGICKALEYAAARERHILAPLYAVPLPRYYCRKISIQGAALHKVGPQTCAAPCCCIKWRRAYCGAMGLCHPFFQGGNSIVLPPL